MQSVTRTFARRYEADPESVGRARAELASFASLAGASSTLVDGVRLAVSEAVTNAVRHAYPLDSGEIRVRALVGEDVLDFLDLMRGDDDRLVLVEIVFQQVLVELLAVEDVQAERP